MEQVKILGKILSILVLASGFLQAMELDHMEDESHQIQVFYKQLVALNPECQFNGQFNEKKILNDYISIHAIYLSCRNIKVIPTEIGCCRTLQSLHLANNQITTIPTEIGDCRELQSLQLSGNPWLASLFGSEWSQNFGSYETKGMSVFYQLCGERIIMIKKYMLLTHLLSVKNSPIDDVPKELIDVIFGIIWELQKK